MIRACDPDRPNSLVGIYSIRVLLKAMLIGKQTLQDMDITYPGIVQSKSFGEPIHPRAGKRYGKVLDVFWVARHL